VLELSRSRRRAISSAARCVPRFVLRDDWLERAGFKPGHRVQVELTENGVLTLRCVPVEQTATP
jgi:hypothetical protein